MPTRNELSREWPMQCPAMKEKQMDKIWSVLALRLVEINFG